MSPSLASLLQRLQSAFASSVQLLAPHSAVCLLCGKSQSQARSAAASNQSKLTTQLRQSLCGDCLSAIPWLTRIVCPKCGRGIRCDDCRRGPQRSFLMNRSAVQYNSAMRALLAQYKYRGNEQLAPLLGDMLLPAFERMSAELSTRYATPKTRTYTYKNISSLWDAITFVPISPERALDRGFNQAEQLASYVAHHYRLPLMHLLVRDRHTEKQSFKTRSQRMRDTQQLFKVNLVELGKLQEMAQQKSRKANGMNSTLRVLLIDDIYTTGSTGEACSQALSQQAERELEICLLTWARS